MTLDQAKDHLLEVAASGIATRSRKYVEIQLDVGTWNALQDWKRQGAALSETVPPGYLDAKLTGYHSVQVIFDTWMGARDHLAALKNAAAAEGKP